MAAGRRKRRERTSVRGLVYAFWTCKSAYAKRWLVAGAAVQGLLVWVAVMDGERMGFPTAGQWTHREAAVLLSLVLLLVFSLLMHHTDTRNGAWGFIHLHRGFAADPKSTSFVPSVLTVESVRAAMTSVILAALLAHRTSFLPREGPIDRVFSQEMWARPLTVFFFIVIAVLAFSLITTMVALLCYEYATRFHWIDPWPRVQLVRKGAQFSRWGFYCLMWSLAVLPALVDFYLGFVSGFVVFCAMWLYYFFPVPPPEVRAVARR